MFYHSKKRAQKFIPTTAANGNVTNGAFRRKTAIKMGHIFASTRDNFAAALFMNLKFDLFSFFVSTFCWLFLSFVNISSD